MDPGRSEEVVSAPGTWFDHSRPPPFRRQLLVTQYQASIISNLVAVALTLAGPRLWILLKEIGFLCLRFIQNLGLGASSLEYGDTWRRNNLIPATERSHSELGAATRLIRIAMHELGRYRRELPAEGEGSLQISIPPHPLLDFWGNMFKRGFDVVIPLALSILFVGVFVAESTGTIMSARIVSDSVALSDSSRCFAPNRTGSADQELAYVDQCYHAPRGTEGCNVFYNQSLNYREGVLQYCPWEGYRCFDEPEPGIAFDTGFIDSRYLGINSPERYLFRRWAVCAPMVTNPPIPIWEGANTTDLWGYNNVTYNRPLLWATGGGIGDNGSHFKPVFNPQMPLKDAWRSIITIDSGNMTFPSYHSDPVFPATRYRNTSENTSPLFLGEGYYNDNEYSSVISCHEAAEICNPRVNGCFAFSGHSFPYIVLGNMLHLNLTDPGEDALHRRLLVAALSGSTVNSNMGLKAASYCNYYDCRDMPKDQWRREVRRWFEASLARIQFNVLRIARGTGNVGEDFQDIAPEYRGICRMVKFKSSGWRNVNFWGLVSLVGLVCGIFAGSLRAGDGDLWLIMGIRRGLAAFRKVFQFATRKRRAQPQFWEMGDTNPT